MPEALVQRLRNGEDVPDSEFDAIYPSWARRSSSIHWTPISVAQRAADLLVESPTDRILDVGSGAGKFCVVAALSRPANYCGVEQRSHLVSLSRATAELLAVPGVRFAHGNMMALDWSGFHAFYLYNPFAENVASLVSAPVDQDIELDPRLLKVYTDFVRRQLMLAAPGTRVVTYHGFGGEMPEAYELVHREEAYTDCLELWVKKAA
jgi:N-acetyl-beta-hexosaminidase